ncbi:exodeoxyribonuclease VII large subunit [Bacteroidota bacterium]
MIDNSLTLSVLNETIQKALDKAFPQSIWVSAEILELNVNSSGHCYIDLIEKSESSDSILARSRATIWASKFRMIRPYFETSTRTKLAPGIKILVKVQVTFHQVYGLSLNITDIDPTYTIGDLARKKQDILNRLSASGVIEMNKELILPEVPQRIAVITSETAAGYGDFLDSLINNNYGFGFQVSLFPSLVQGDMAERSVIAAFEKIFDRESSFDVVVLIRGGGSQADLECFNSYDLALNIAQFPLPVLTGIGHERDETIADIVAHTSLKTPTAVAEFLIDRLVAFLEYMEELHNRFQQSVNQILQQEKKHIEAQASALSYSVKQIINHNTQQIDFLNNRIESSVLKRIKDERKSLQLASQRLRFQWKTGLNTNNKHLFSLEEKRTRVTREFLKICNKQLIVNEKTLQLLRPESVLSRGYSITYVNGKSVKSVSDLAIGDKIITTVTDGEIEGRAEAIRKSKK